MGEDVVFVHPRGHTADPFSTMCRDNAIWDQLERVEGKQFHPLILIHML